MLPLVGTQFPAGHREGRRKVGAEGGWVRRWVEGGGGRRERGRAVAALHGTPMQVMPPFASLCVCVSCESCRTLCAPGDTTRAMDLHNSANSAVSAAPPAAAAPAHSARTAALHHTTHAQARPHGRPRGPRRSVVRGAAKSMSAQGAHGDRQAWPGALGSLCGGATTSPHAPAAPVPQLPEVGVQRVLVQDDAHTALPGPYSKMRYSTAGSGVARGRMGWVG